MNPMIEKIVKPVIDRAVDATATGIENSRRLAESSSDMVTSSTKTVAVVSDKTLKLNKISHNLLAKLIKEQAHMMEGNLKAVAKRLDVAANANNARDLWDGQVNLVSKTRDRVGGDVRKVVEIFADAGQDLRDLIGETVGEFGKSGKKVSKRVSKTASKAGKKATSTAKKTRKKATTAAKKAKKKTTRVAKKATTRKTRRAA